MENQYFNESLQNFVRDFAYGGAIRHLVDLGYDGPDHKRVSLSSLPGYHRQDRPGASEE